MATQTVTKKSIVVSPPIQQHHKDSEELISWFSSITTYLGYAVLILFGHIRDWLGKVTGNSRYFNARSIPPKGYAPLLQDWENFYTRRLFHRIQDCWNRPIAGPPFAGKLPVVMRESTNGNYTLDVKKTSTNSTTTSKEEIKTCINLGSYNYLGFADDFSRTCKQDVMQSLEHNPVSLCAPFAEGGYTSSHRRLEQSIASFVDKEDAVIFNMGWATNGLGIPSIVGKGSLVISDALNHNSIVAGARSSGAEVRVFRHNDIAGLSALVRRSIIEGQPRSHRPWKKILICVEGIYSMEGEFVDLPGVVSVAKQYKCYIYLDEAHSIGAMGPSGRGIVEYWKSKGANVDFKDVDIMMGTFTKSFGAMGGYIAGTKALVSSVRKHTAGFTSDNSMSPIVCQQIITSLAVIKGDGRFAAKTVENGTMSIGESKLRQLTFNARYMRAGLRAIGVEVFGDEDSPVIPVMLYNPTKISAFSRECLKRDLAVVVVGFPATPLVSSRARFCVSAGHSKDDLDAALKVVADVAGMVRMRYAHSTFG